MATGEMVTAGASAEDRCASKGAGSGAVARGLMRSPSPPTVIENGTDPIPVTYMAS
jgi:hypothetical protein